jgi:hypothetical protein
LNNSGSRVNLCISLALLIALLLVASLAGSILVGIFIGLPEAVGPAIITHLLVAAPLAVAIGLPAFFLLRRFGLQHSVATVVLVAVGIASVPLLVLLVPDLARYGLGFLLVDKSTMLYTLSVIMGAVVGGVVFAVGSRRLVRL